ncbi:MAG: ImmA/IrrE family metallo-endopeptidase [Armatimonadota bacterium]
MSSTKTYYLDPLERYAESAWKRLELEPPVDLDAVRKFLRIRFYKKYMDPDIYGLYVVTQKGQRVIRVNSLLDLHPVRRRWTIAHEIGHHLMLPKNAQPGTVCELRRTYVSSRPIEEIRADRFAAALLMPHWLVREWWSELASNPTGRVPVMASRFGVSLSAMRIRVKELGLKGRYASAQSRFVTYR